MRRTLSSPLTIFWKFVFPALFIGLSSYILVMQWFSKFTKPDGSSLSYGLISLLTVLTLALLVWVVSWSLPFKRVAVDDQALYVSNYFTEIRIPLSEVSVVYETIGRGRQYFTLSIDLRHASAFGKKIVFRPKFRLYWSGIHPVIRELQVLCEKARHGEHAAEQEKGM